MLARLRLLLRIDLEVVLHLSLVEVEEDVDDIPYRVEFVFAFVVELQNRAVRNAVGLVDLLVQEVIEVGFVVNELGAIVAIYSLEEGNAALLLCRRVLPLQSGLAHSLIVTLASEVGQLAEEF